MASTIGTNIVVDEKEILSFIQGVLNELEKFQDNQGLSKAQYNLKELYKAVREGESLLSNIFYANDAKDIMRILDAKNTPYIILPCMMREQEMLSITIRGRDKEIFLAAQDSVFIQNGRIYRELDFNVMIRDIKNEPIFKGQRTPIFEFKNSVTRAIFTAELAKNDVPYGLDDKSGKVIVYPNQAYKENKKDLVTTIVNMAAKYTIFAASTIYRKYQELVANTNNETLQEFINRAQQGLDAKIENMSGSKAILYDCDTDRFAFENRKIIPPILSTIPVTSDMSRTQKFTMLSKYTSEVVRGEDKPILTSDASYSRRAISANQEVNSFMRKEKALNKALSEIRMKAGKYVRNNDKLVTPDKKCMAEIEFIIRELKTNGLPGYSDKFVHVLCQNLDGSIKNGTRDIGFEFVSAKGLDNYIVKDATTIEKETEIEKEGINSYVY